MTPNAKLFPLFKPSVRSEAWLCGAVAVLAFSGSLPATRIAVLHGMSPWFLTGARATIAAVLGAVCLWVFRAPLPKKGDIVSLLVVAGGAVLGFPLLTALALQTVPSVHSIVFTGLLPLATAVSASLLGEKHPSPLFWLFSGLGAACILLFAFTQGFGASGGDLLMLAAVVVCGLGYAEGGRLGRRLGGWQVICWALLIALPVMGPLMIVSFPDYLGGIDLPAWLGLGYVAIFSMLIGFFFWYRGLSLGGIAAVGQLQLVQPFLALILAALLLKEAIGVSVLAVMAAIVACVLGARKYADQVPTSSVSARLPAGTGPE